MHSSETIVNSAFTGFRERPISHVAALAVLGSLGWVAHEGIDSLHLGGVGSALMIIFASLAVLQWLSLGRYEACRDASDDSRAAEVIRLALIFGAIETGLYALGGLALLAREGHAVFTGWGWSVAVIAAAGLAYVNYRLKWAACDPVGERETSGGPTGGQRVHDVLFNGPALPAPDAAFAPSETARYTSDDGVVDFEDALRKRGERAVTEVDPRIQANADRDAAERFRLWKRREQRRRQRGTIAA